MHSDTTIYKKRVKHNMKYQLYTNASKNYL